MLKKIAILAFSSIISIQAANASITNGSPYENSTFKVIGDKVTVKHNSGEVTIKANPKKIVTFDLAIADILNEVGIEITALPQKELPKYLSKFKSKKYKTPGAMKEANFEKIAEISPDLIIISGRLVKQFDELNKLAPTLFVVSHASNYFNALSNNIDVLKAVFPNKAKALDKKLNALLKTANEIKQKVEKKKLTSLTIMTNDGKIAAFGVGSRFGIINDS